MPSKHSPADSAADERAYPVEKILEHIGEDPGRFLDRDLFEHGVVRLEGRDNAAWDEAHQRVVRDGDVSAPGAMVRDRIQGIDHLAVAAAWMAVERQLERTPEGGRDVVIHLLRKRIIELEATGERELPGLSPEQQRERAVEAFENSESGNAVIRGIDGEPTGRSEGRTADQKLAALTDGGDGE